MKYFLKQHTLHCLLHNNRFLNLLIQFENVSPFRINSFSNVLSSSLTSYCLFRFRSIPKSLLSCGNIFFSTNRYKLSPILFFPSRFLTKLICILSNKNWTGNFCMKLLNRSKMPTYSLSMENSSWCDFFGFFHFLWYVLLLMLNHFPITKFSLIHFSFCSSNAFSTSFMEVLMYSIMFVIILILLISSSFLLISFCTFQLFCQFF